MDKNQVLLCREMSSNVVSLLSNMQKMEKTDELNRGFESLSNRHILLGKRNKR